MLEKYTDHESSCHLTRVCGFAVGNEQHATKGYWAQLFIYVDRIVLARVISPVA